MAPSPLAATQKTRFEATHDPHYIVCVRIDQHRINYDTMQKFSNWCRVYFLPFVATRTERHATAYDHHGTYVTLGDVRGDGATSGRVDRKMVQGVLVARWHSSSLHRRLERQTEQPDSMRRMIIITSSTYRLTSTAAANTEWSVPLYEKEKKPLARGIGNNAFTHDKECCVPS